MKKRALLAFWGVLILVGSAYGQAPASSASPSIILKVQVTVTRYMGENKISSQPYVLSLAPNENGSLRVGAEVAVPTTIAPPAGTGASAQPTPSYTLQQVGTQVDCTASPQPDGRYKLRLTVTDRSVLPTAQASEVGSRIANVPTFRNLNLSSTIFLGNGQSTQFSSAPDKVSGEVFKVDVALSYEK
jgi:hypothetical protein